MSKRAASRFALRLEVFAPLILLCCASTASAQEFANTGLDPAQQATFEARANQLRASRSAMADEVAKRDRQYRTGVIATTNATLRLWEAEAIARENQQAEDEAQFTIDLKTAVANLGPAPTGAVGRPTPAELRSQAVQTERTRSLAATNLQKAATFLAVGPAEFYLLPGNRWVQRFNGADVRTFKEIHGRSERNNYLMLAQENDPAYHVTFNFRTNMMRYAYTADYSRITAIGKFVDVSNVTQARFATGTLKMRPFSKDKWTETSRGPNPKSFAFIEMSRSADRVKLFDPARGVWLDIIPGTNSITYANISNPVPRPLYTITELRAVQFVSLAVID